MKKLLLFIFMALLSCDKEVDSEPRVPEYFDVTYEIIGADGVACDSCVNKIVYSVSRYEYIEDGKTVVSDTKTEYYGISIPYSKDIRLKTLSEEDGVYGNSDILFWVYALEGYVGEIRLYIDGKLVDSENEYPKSINRHQVPMSVRYIY